MKIISALILTLSLTIPAFAGSFTVTSTAVQDATLARMLVRINTKRSAETPPKPAVTVDQMVNNIITNAFKSYVTEEKVKAHQSNRSKWGSRTQAQRDQIQAILDQ